MQAAIIEKGKELFANGTVDRIIGWSKGEFAYDTEIKVYRSAEDFEKNFVFDGLSGANVSKYLIAESRKPGKIGVFIKPCDSYSLAQLLKEHRVLKENIYVVAIPCKGNMSPVAISNSTDDAILEVKRVNENDVEIVTTAGTVKKQFAELKLNKCMTCKTKKHAAVYDEMIGEEGAEEPYSMRFEQVSELENMTSEERFNFWRNELSKCIRCNACRNVCPACSCEKCVFDNPDSGISQKAAADSFEENMFHIIRAFHVAGRCTDCGECSRVCPQGIPLHLLNRKFIKDINELYGEYQAGENPDERFPLTNYTKEDVEPSVVYERGGNK